MAAENPIVRLFVTHSNITSMNAETRFTRAHTVAKIKDKLYMATGTSPEHQTLTLQAADGTPVAVLEDDKMLGFYSPEDGQLLHVTDTDPESISKDGGLENTAQVEKFTMSKEKYENSGGEEFRKFRAARAAKKAAMTVDDTFQAEEAKEITVGSRCEMPKSGRRGTIRYVGLVPEVKAGYWVGVQLDEPLGKCDGSVKGKRYFQTEPKFATFVRPKGVVQGDFPELDPMASDEEDDEL